MFAKTVKFIVFGFVGVVAVGGLMTYVPTDGFVSWSSSDHTLIRTAHQWGLLEDPKYISASARNVFLIKDKKVFIETAQDYLGNKAAVSKQFETLKEALGKGQPIPNVDIPDRLVGEQLSQALEVAMTRLFATPGLMLNPNGYVIGLDEALQEQSADAERAYLEANENAYRSMLIKSDQAKITADENNFILSGIEDGYDGVLMHVQADFTDTKKFSFYEGSEQSAPYYYQTLFVAYRDVESGSDELTFTPKISEQFPKGMPHYVNESEDHLFRSYSRVIADL